jgi:hypothetical protein
MDYRDERETLRAKVNELERDLARAEATIAELRGRRSARRMRTATRVGLSGGLVLMIFAGVVYLRLRAASWSPPMPSPVRQQPSAPSEARFEPDPGLPMFARMDAQDTLDPILWGTSDRKVCLAGFDGRSGARRWLNCSHPKEISIQRRSAVIGDRLVVAFERTLEAFDVKSGARLWTTDIDVPLMRHCLSPEGTLRIVLESSDAFVVHAESGRLDPSTQTYDCQPIWNDYGHGTPPGQHFDGGWSVLPKIAGMVVEKKVEHGGVTIALGYRRKRPRVPMAAAIDDQGAVAWSRGLPSDDPELTDTAGPVRATLDAHSLCASYWGHDGLRFGCWDVATGKTLWDALAPRDAPMVLTEDRLFISGHGLTALDRTSGKWLYDIPERKE